MARPDSPAPPSWIRGLHSRVEKWRRGKQTGSRMPDALWDEAARLARAHGVNMVARHLHLDYYNLKRRTTGRAKKAPVKRERRPTFVELDLSEAFGKGEFVVVLEHPGGAKMTLRFPRSEGVDLAALAKSFWSQGQ